MADKWRQAPLSELAHPDSPITYGVVKPGKEDANGVLFIRGGDIVGGRVLVEQLRTITSEVSQQYRRTQLYGGEIIVSLVGNPGQVAIVPDELKGANIARQVGLVRLRHDVDARYVKYFLSSPKGQEDLGAHSLGSVQQVINLRDLKTVVVPIPPLQEQRAIAHILGTLDDKIELNRKQNETLEAMARALFKAWFVDFEPVRAKMEGRWRRGQSLPGLPAHLYDLFPDRLVESELGEVPEGWKYAPLSEFIEILDSRRVPLSGKQRAERRGIYPYHGAAGVMDFVDDYLFDGIHVLVGEDGSVVKDDGRPYTQYVWGKFWVNNHAHVLRGRGITNETLLIFLDQCDIAPFVTGAVQPKLSQGNLKKIPFIDAGEWLLNGFGEVISPLFKKIRDATEELRALVQIRDTLLPKLISGELRVPDVDKFMEAMA